MVNLPRLNSRYEIRDVLGQGGMGIVYKAYDSVIRREVALKTLRDAPDPAALETFQKECGVLASMAHPNTVEIFDLGEFEENGAHKPYFVMPLLPGKTLEDLIRMASQRLTVDRVVEIISQTCRGLQAAHERGLIHRDLKPSNIFVLDDDSVKIIDFGVAHICDSRTTMGLKGTLAYMSPEQIEMKPLSPLSDLFSLAVVAYETLTLRRPFQGKTQSEMVEAILHQIPPPVSEFNPAVSSLLSRVIHKALAKQPFHRFASAREFAETVQKALRNERLEVFDPSRIQPRVQRAARAYEQEDYQFAAEILSELQAEGHLDPAITTLHRQINQRVRQKTIQQLLQSARTRIEEQEYPLALQKLHEVLQLEPNHSEAINLRDQLETRRTEEKLEDWLRLARRHLSSCAFGHAREALRNVLQLRPNESRALQMLAELTRKEQEFSKVRQQKQELYQSAVRIWENGDVSAALGKLESLLELDRRNPDPPSSESGTLHQNFYNQVRSEHDAIKNAYAEARQHLTERNFAAALAGCEEYLKKYPSHALFQALKFDVEEQQRQDQSSQILEIHRRVEVEPDLERRVNILKEAVEHYPAGGFESALRLMKDKRDLVNSIVSRARSLEEQSLFNEALSQWEILKTIYGPYPGLNFEIERITKRRDQQATLAAKGRWVEQIDAFLELADYKRAEDALQEAREEFPSDLELSELEKIVHQGMERAAEAQGLLAQGQQLVAAHRMEEGLELLRRANQLDRQNPVIKAVLVNVLLDQARRLVDSNWRAAEPLLEQALEIDPGNSVAVGLRTLLEDNKRNERVDHWISQARQAQATGDLSAALERVEQGLAEFPKEFRLTQLRMTLSKSLDQVPRLSTKVEDSETLVASRYPESGLQPAPTSPVVVSASELPTISNQSARETAPLTVPEPAGVDDSEFREHGSATPSSGLAEGLPIKVRRTLNRWIWLGVASLLVVLLGGVWVHQRRPPSTTSQPALPNPAPPHPIRLGILTTPPGARIFINDQVRGTADLVLELLPGSYQIRAELEGYVPTTIPLELKPDSVLSPMEIVLKPAPGAGTSENQPPLESAAKRPQGSSVSLAKRRKALETQAPVSSLAVESAPLPGTLRGYLQLKRSPAGSQVVLEGGAEPQPRVLNEDHMELREGAYTLTVTAPGFSKLIVPLHIEPSKTEVVELNLQPIKEPELGWKEAWDDAAGWSTEGDWQVHKGGNFVLSTLHPITGAYEFTLWRKSKNIQWVLNYTDEHNYDLFEIDKKFFLRTRIRDGRKSQAVKVSHKLEKQSSYSFQLEVTQQAIVTRVLDGGVWVAIDEWKDAGPVTGKFGFYIQGRDQVGLSHFKFKPR